jgi:hypothetical protein
MEQAAISRCPNIKRHTPIRRTLPDRSSFVQLRFQLQCGTHFTPRVPKLGALRYFVSCRSATRGNKTRDTTSYSLALRCQCLKRFWSAMS